MPLLKSAKKALRSSKAKTARNEKLRAKLRKATNKALKLIELGESKLAAEQLQTTYKTADKAAKRNIIHTNKAKRIKSRLTKKFNNIQKDVQTAPKTS